MKKTYEEEDDLKELLELEMIREAQLLEEALLSDEDLKGLDISDDDVEASYAELVQRLKDEGVYRSNEEMEKRSEKDSEKRYSSTGPEDATAAKKHFSVGKAAGFIAVILLSVFAGSMTSEANRQYLIKQIQYLRGDNSAIVADNDEKADFPETDEIHAIEEIEKAIDVKVPEFYYKSIPLDFLSYSIDKNMGYAQIIYGYSFKNTLAFLSIYNHTEDKSSVIFNSHGDNTIELDSDIEIYIQETSNKDSEPEYEAMWMYQDALYKFTGRMNWEEFEKVVKGIQFNT
ncbi:MAG: hypothetical protein IJW67_04930 [Blautia sp.]|nr:hypothetical protein [Blautia sp.]